MTYELLTKETKNERTRGRGLKQIEHVYETRRYAAGTRKGRFQLWIDGKWSEDITDKMGPAPMEGGWPRLLNKETKTRKLRGGNTRQVVCNTYEFPAETRRGRLQLWIDGTWAGDITEITLQKQQLEAVVKEAERKLQEAERKLQEAERKFMLVWDRDDVSAEEAAAEVQWLGPFPKSVVQSEDLTAALLKKLSDEIDDA